MDSNILLLLLLLLLFCQLVMINFLTFIIETIIQAEQNDPNIPPFLLNSEHVLSSSWSSSSTVTDAKQRSLIRNKLSIFLKLEIDNNNNCESSPLLDSSPKENTLRKIHYIDASNLQKVSDFINGLAERDLILIFFDFFAYFSRKDNQDAADFIDAWKEEEEEEEEEEIEEPSPFAHMQHLVSFLSPLKAFQIFRFLLQDFFIPVHRPKVSGSELSFFSTTRTNPSPFFIMQKEFTKKKTARNHYLILANFILRLLLNVDNFANNHQAWWIEFIDLCYTMPQSEVLDEKEQFDPAKDAHHEELNLNAQDTCRQKKRCRTLDATAQEQEKKKRYPTNSWLMIEKLFALLLSTSSSCTYFSKKNLDYIFSIPDARLRSDTFFAFSQSIIVLEKKLEITFLNLLNEHKFEMVEPIFASFATDSIDASLFKARALSRPEKKQNHKEVGKREIPEALLKNKERRSELRALLADNRSTISCDELLLIFNTRFPRHDVSLEFPKDELLLAIVERISDEGFRFIEREIYHAISILMNTIQGCLEKKYQIGRRGEYGVFLEESNLQGYLEIVFPLLKSKDFYKFILDPDEANDDGGRYELVQNFCLLWFYSTLLLRFEGQIDGLSLIDLWKPIFSLVIENSNAKIETQKVFTRITLSIIIIIKFFFCSKSSYRKSTSSSYHSCGL